MKKSWWIAIIIVILVILAMVFWNNLTGNAIENRGTLLGCEETDNGKDYETAGITTLKYEAKDKSWEDKCAGNNVLTEYYCDSNNNEVIPKTYECPNECIDGACI